jgi:1-phosphofructokinase family hexose kinase
VIRTQASTRANLEIISGDGSVTEILEPGGSVTEGEVERLLTACAEAIAESPEGTQVALSGSLPPGAPNDLYAQIIRLAHDYGCRALLDTSGEALRQGLRAAPDLVKPNRSEASWFAGRSIVNEEGAGLVARQLITAGAKSAAISLGADGIIWERSNGEGALMCKPPSVMVRSSVGCGDAALAGFAVAHARGQQDTDLLRLAVACGTANCLADSPGLVDPSIVARIIENVAVEEVNRNWANSRGSSS